MGLLTYRWGIKQFGSNTRLQLATALQSDPRRPTRGWYTSIQVYNRPTVARPLIQVARVTTRLKKSEKRLLRDKKLWLTDQYKAFSRPIGFGHAGEWGTPEWADPKEWVQASLITETIRVRADKPTERKNEETKWASVDWSADDLIAVVNGAIESKITQPLVDWITENISVAAPLILECGNLPDDEFHAVHRPTRCVFD